MDTMSGSLPVAAVTAAAGRLPPWYPQPRLPVRTGVLLAGGSSRRAGVDKRYLVLGGRTLLRRNLEFLRALFPTVVVSVGPGQAVDLGDAPPADVVADLWPGASPLAGIATVLERCRRAGVRHGRRHRVPGRGGGPRRARRLPRRRRRTPPHRPITGSRCSRPTDPAACRRCASSCRTAATASSTASPGSTVAEVPFPDEAAFHNINTMSAYRGSPRADR